jgi:DNA polymerase-3 subunit beta
MTGILFDLKPEDTTFVGTDAHRLVRYLRSDIKTGLEASFIVPRKPLLSLKNILQSYDGKVRVDYDNSKVGFTLESLSVVSKLIEGKYPNYGGVIPASSANMLKVERLPFLQRMRSISPYANQSTHQVRLKMEQTIMRLTAENVDASYRATASVPCTFESENEEPFEIGFSSKFLQEILSYLESDEVVMKLSTPSAAGLILPFVETEEKDEDILMLLMPVMLNDYAY